MVEFGHVETDPKSRSKPPPKRLGRHGGHNPMVNMLIDLVGLVIIPQRHGASMCRGIFYAKM